jgi:hypothetical protein
MAIGTMKDGGRALIADFSGKYIVQWSYEHSDGESYQIDYDRKKKTFFIERLIWVERLDEDGEPTGDGDWSGENTNMTIGEAMRLFNIQQLVD